MWTERTQVLLSKEQVERLRRTARRERKSLGAVIREAVDAYMAQAPDRRRAAVARLLELDAPVDDWAVMKAEILRGVTDET